MAEEPRWGPATTYRSSPSLRRGAPRQRTGSSPQRPGSAQRSRGERAYREDGGGQPPRQPPRRPSPPPAPRGGAPGRRRHPARTVVVLLLLALVGYPLALGAVAYTSVTRVGALPDSAVAATPGQTILLVGSDSREGLTRDQMVELSTGTDVEGKRTDTIMLLHRPAGGGPTVLLSLPRDSYVDIPGYEPNKINAAYAFGGPSLLVQTVEGATGIHVDGYVETGLGGFANLVDAVGGVEMCPEKAIRDPKAGLDIQAGCQTMGGATALGYARTRDFDANGDLGRAQRQRAIIGAVAHEAASPAVLLNPLRSFPLAAAGGSALSVDDGFGPADLYGFVMGVRAVAGGQAVSLNVPIASDNRRTKAGLVVDWDEEEAGRVFQAIKDDDTESIRAIAAAEATGSTTSATS
ncbi:LCP family protein [Quadrisphaera sp. KR29]|uniref:LCP family protein n=1 Tax=Quadrisphaera sp. KR29 TaxID=3461391 RepID=UPI004044AE6D